MPDFDPITRKEKYLSAIAGDGRSGIVPEPITREEMYLSEIARNSSIGNGIGGEGTTDYNALKNKPKINGVEISGNLTLEDIGVDDAINELDESFVPITDEEIESIVPGAGISASDVPSYVKRLEALEKNQPGAPNYTFDGVKLNDIFASASDFKAAVAAGDFSKIHIGDYWEIKLNGTFRDYGSYTVPSGVKYYSDSALTAGAGTTPSALMGQYETEAAVKVTISGADYFVATSDCTDYYERVCNNAVMLLEVAAINPYWRYGDSGSLSGAVNHVLFISRDCIPFTMRMRKANTVWEDTTTQNPWIGSALYKTLNDPDNGVVKLIKATDIGAYMYEGADGNGMRYYGETRSSVTASTSSGAWASRGKLFLPTEDEIWGRIIFTLNSYNAHTKLQIFDYSRRHISKGIGNGAYRSAWWCMSAYAGNATFFCYVNDRCIPGNTNASNMIGTPVCFLIL